MMFSTIVLTTILSFQNHRPGTVPLASQVNDGLNEICRMIDRNQESQLNERLKAMARTDSKDYFVVRRSLLYCIAKKNGRFADNFLNWGLDPNSDVYLAAAIRTKNDRIYEKLIGLGADLDGGKRYPPMMEAIGKKDKRKYLIDLVNRGANVNARSSDVPLIEWCIQSKDEFGLAFLIQNGATVSAIRDGGTVARNFEGGKSIAAILMSHGVDYNRLDISGMAPIHYCAEDGNLEAVQDLVEFGADPFLKSKSGKTALDFAVENKARACVSFLTKLEKTRKPRIESASFWSARSRVKRGTRLSAFRLE